MGIYPAIKHLHLLFVSLSIGGFVFRGLWRLSGRRLPRTGWPHRLPHINDTLLLLAGVALAVITDQYPIVDAWLTAKMLGLLVYIVLGWIALGEAAGRSLRAFAWLGALLAFGYVASVALTKSPLGVLAWLLPLKSAGA